MTNQIKYAECLEEMPEKVVYDAENGPSYREWKYNLLAWVLLNLPTIREALRLCDKLEGGPGNKVLMAGIDAFNNSFGSPLTRQKASLTAMIAQLKKEEKPTLKEKGKDDE